MSVISNNILAGASGQAGGAPAGYEIERSLRFNEDDSAYLNRTPSSAGNRKTWTWSGWVKISDPDSFNRFFTAGNGTTDSTFLGFLIRDNDVFTLEGGSTIYRRTSSVFRDVSAWYHLVVAFDTTQASSGDRIKIYINGVQLTDFATSNNPSLNSEHPINNSVIHDIGANHYGGSLSYNSNFYLADVHFIDGQALAPTDFGEFDDNGVWQPIEYAGTYGTNGFHLPFSDNSTAAALGTDAAGSNDWTVNNISVTPGAGNDSLFDSPTNGTQTDTGAGGEVSGNYCTWNPLDSNSNYLLSNGNLDLGGYASAARTNGTISVSSGKWYFEVTNTDGWDYVMVGVGPAGTTDSYPGSDSTSWSFLADGNKYHNGSGTSVSPAGNLAGDIIGVALDLDNGKIYFSANGVYVGSGDPAAGSNPAYSSVSGTLTPAIRIWNSGNSNKNISANFGQRPFAYSAPTGFKALCTANLPDPTIADGSTVMDVKLYTGNGSTQTISGLGFEPDFAWIKVRNGAVDHVLYDQVRGVQRYLSSNTTGAEGDQTGTPNVGLYAFTPDGFSVGDVSGGSYGVNGSSGTYVAWTWDAGTSNTTYTAGVTLGAGSISSVVRANPSAGFSVVSYTGVDNAIPHTIGHGLGATPQLVIIKNLTDAENWAVYHASLGNTKYLQLNTTNAAATSSAYWNNTDPTSTVITLNNSADVQRINRNYIAYCFAPVEGYSAFGSYTGNGSTNGPFVYTGFSPAFFMVKASSTTGNWIIFDKERPGYNPEQNTLCPNLSSGENASVGTTNDFLSNGFKIRGTNDRNTSGATYVWAAFAENPFKTARAR